ISGDRAYAFQDIIDIAKRVFPEIEIGVKEISKAGLANTPPWWFPFDISKARSEFGFEHDYDLERAFRDYGEWLRRYE
ncbi:hypothetical protein ACFLV4_02310, partial [Chloroflexota bacterium]